MPVLSCSVAEKAEN